MNFDGWREVNLEDIIHFNPKESIAKSQLAKKIAMEKLKPNNRTIDGYETAEFKGGTKFRNGDTLFARITPCLENGKTAQVSILDEHEIGFGSTEYIVLREKLNKSVNDFIYYLAISPRFRDIAIKSMIGTSGRQRVQQDVLENTKIPLPELDEQKTIATTLSCLDDKIELNNRINKTLEEMAQAIFKSWFVDFEPFQDGEFEDSELGGIPKGWRAIELSEMSTVQNGYAFKSVDYQEIGCKMVRTTNIGSDGFVNNIDLINLPNEFLIDKKYENFRFIPFDTVLVMVGASVGKIGIITEKNIPSLQNQNMWRFRPTLKHISPIYIHYTVKLINERVKNWSSGSARDFYRKDSFLKANCIKPLDGVLKDFRLLVEPIFTVISNNLNENENLESVRDTILPKLMSGEIRVPIEEV